MADEEAQRDTMLLLGAGASFGARVGLSSYPVPPPLGDDLAARLREWLESNDPEGVDRERRFAMGNPYDRTAPPRWIWEDEALTEVLRVLEEIQRAAESDGTPRFEAQVNRLIEQDRIEVLVLLNRVTAIYMLSPEGPFAAGVDRFDDVLASIGERLTGVVTLNYDVLLESAVERSSRRFWYPEIDPSPDTGGAIPFFKIHGSCNWLQTKPGGTGATLEIARKNSTPVHFNEQVPLGLSVDTEGVHSVWGQVNAFMRLRKRLTRPPIIVTYGRGKPSTHSRDRIDRVRAACQAEIARAQRIVIVGVRPPTADDDPACTAIFECVAARPQRLYIGPDDSDCAAMAARGFDVRQATLLEALEAGLLAAEAR